MGEVELGGADVNFESLSSGGQVEEWVPLRAGKDGITWYEFCVDLPIYYKQILTLSPPNCCFDRFARLRLSLRFELLSLDLNLDASETGRERQDERCPSVGLKKIQKLSRLGAHEDLKHGSKHSMSTPDLPHYFGNMLGV